MTDALLKSDALTVAYGGLLANDKVSISVGESQCVGLIGPNGAGKTTFLDAVTGFAPVTSGEVIFGGRKMTRLRPEQRSHAGMSRTFQAVELFEDLTVYDNLMVTAEEVHWWSFLADMVYPSRRSGQEENVDWALRLLGIEHIADEQAGELPEGLRKLVGVARALAARPKLVLLDEPAAGLDTRESRDFGAQLRNLHDEGISTLLIDHDMGLIMSVCDYLYVLDFGKIIAEGTPEAVRADEKVISAYLGQSAADAQMHGDDPIEALRDDVIKQRTRIEEG